MKQNQCLGCAYYIPPEKAGFSGGDGTPGEMKKNGRCAETNRIIQRMKECPFTPSQMLKHQNREVTK